MELHGYMIEQDCPECGKVRLTADSFEGISYTREGRLTTRFECPRCGMHLVTVYEVGDDVVTLMTGAAIEAIGVKPADEAASEPISVRPGSHPQTYNPDAVAKPVSSDAQDEGTRPEAPAPAGSEQPADGSDEGSRPGQRAQDEPKEQAAKGADKGPGLTINYMPMSSNRLMTFDIRFDTRPAGKQDEPAREEPVEYSPSDEDKARLEYFHRQLEGLETVDDAIDEIDNGYNLSDGGGEDDDHTR